MALFGIPTGAMNPEHNLPPQQVGPTPEQLELRRKAEEEYAAENPGPWSQAAKMYHDSQPQPEPEKPIQGKLMEAQQEVEQTNQEVQSLKEDPAANLALSTGVRAVQGTGVGMPKMPEMPSMKEMQGQAQSLEAKRVSFDQSKIPKWYDSQSFNMGLLSFGLNLLSGNDWATSFNQAGQVFDKGFGKEKRAAWADDLRAQGYDDHEIQAYIETGDNKVLSDPAEKKFREQQYQLGAAQLQKAQYESSPEYQAYQRAEKDYDRQFKEAQLQSQINYQNASLGMQQAQLQMKQAMANQKQGDWTSRDYTQLRSTVQTGLRTMEQKLVQSRLADASLGDLQAAIDRGDNAAAQGAYQSFREYQARAMLGGNATLTPKAIEEVTGLPSKVDSVINMGMLSFGGEPSKKWIAAQKANVGRALANEHTVANELISNFYRTIKDEYGPEVAARAARRVSGGTNLGSMKFDENGNMIEQNPNKYKANSSTVQIQR